MAVRTILMLVVAVSALVLSLDVPVGAASRITEDFADLVKRAPIVVEVDITANKNEQNEATGLPFTLSQARILRVLRGDVRSALVLERFGGSKGAETVHVPGQAQLMPGDRAVLLLIPSPLENGRYRVLGGDAGCVLSEDSEHGERKLRRVTGRFDYYVADETSLSGFVSRQTPELADEEFDALVEALITTGRPVLTAAVASAPLDSAPLPVLKSAAAPAPVESSEAPLFFKVGVFLACVTLAWALMRVSRKLSPVRRSSK